MNSEKFKENKGEKINYYTIPSFEKTNLVNHAFTTRDLNLGFNTIDSDKDITNNFKVICDELETDIDSSVISSQTHKTEIRVVTEEDRGKGLVKERDYSDIDGLVTNRKNIALFTFYADCVPLFFLDPKNKVIGVAHAGWRGTVGKIAEAMIQTMKGKYNSDAKDILVAIGPSIGQCCYEVGQDVYSEFKENFTDISDILKSLDNNKWKLDLWQANKMVLEQSGISNENITISKLCTSCNSDTFFSYRKEIGKTGRMGAVIMLKQ